MASWYDSWLEGNEKHKQISAKASAARKRKWETEKNSRSISKAGISSSSPRSVKQDSKQRSASGGVWDGGNETQKTKDRLLQQFKKKR